MVDFYPFRAIRYGANAGLMPDLICPPYDVISKNDEKELLLKNINNMVRLELCEIDGSSDENRYTNAAASFQEMLASNVLIKDEKASYYLLRQKFSIQGQTQERIAIIGALRLEELGEGVLPHENTASGPKEDRLALMHATSANFSPLMMLYQDPQKVISRLIKDVVLHDPIYDFVADNMGYTVWAISDPEKIQVIEEALKMQHVYVADGHHRYETALSYAKSSSGDQDHPSNFVLCALIDFEDKGLEILPYYRVLHGLDESQMQKIQDVLRFYFVSRPINVADYSASSIDAIVATMGQTQVVLGAIRKDETPELLTPANDIIPEPDSEAPPSTQVRSVEAFVIQEMILKPVLGEDFAKHIMYVHDGEDAIELINSGVGQLAFFVKGLPADVFRSVVQAGIRLPRKSTYFYPKLPSGLAINSLSDQP